MIDFGSGISAVSDPISGTYKIARAEGDEGSPFFISPLGGSADDWPRLNALLATAAGKGPVVMGPGTWLCKTPGVVPSQTVLIGGPNVLVNSSLTFSGGAVQNCVFNTTLPTLTLATTLAADNIQGGTTVSVNASVSANSIIGIISQFGSKLLEAYYRVITVSGMGPFTLTLDRPVLNQFATNDKVYTVPFRPHLIYIYGNGMQISGTGDTALQFWLATDCHVFDVNITADLGTMGDYSAALDLGCRNSSFTRVNVDGTGLGLVMSSTEACTFRDCNSRNILGLSNSYNVFDAQECAVINCEGYGSAAGILLGSNGTGKGCQNTQITGGKFWSNANGIVINSGTQNTIIDASVRFNTTTGILCSAAGGNPVNVRVRGAVVQNTLDIDANPTVVAGFTIEPRTLLFFGAGLVDVGGNTLSLYPGSTPDVALASGRIIPMRVPRGRLRNLRISHATAGANAGSNITYTVYKNGSPTTLTVAVDVTDVSGQDVDPTHVVVVAEGDKIAVLETNTAIATSPVGLEATVEHSAF